MNARPLFLVLALVAGGCMSLPPGTAERALYADARTVVEYNENLDWFVDRHAVEEAVPGLMPSLCRVPQASRDRVHRWLEQQIENEGGSAERVYMENGRDLGAVSGLLRLERTKMILDAAEANADEDCPFWVEEDEDFGGIQTVARRFTILAESVGGGGLIFQDGEVALGGSGGGRLILSWGFDERFSLGLGAELGAVATLPEADGGGRTVEALFAGSVPLLFRIQDSLTIFDIEAALTARSIEDEIVGPGYRVRMGFGFSTLRGGAFLPQGLIYVGYEMFPAHDSGGVEHSIRVGTRIGLNWDPF